MEFRIHRNPDVYRDLLVLISEDVSKFECLENSINVILAKKLFDDPEETDFYITFTEFPNLITMYEDLPSIAKRAMRFYFLYAGWDKFEYDERLRKISISKKSWEEIEKEILDPSDQ